MRGGTCGRVSERIRAGFVAKLINGELREFERRRGETCGRVTDWVRGPLPVVHRLNRDLGSREVDRRLGGTCGQVTDRVSG